MVDFDILNQISHSTSMLSVLDYYQIKYHRSGNNRYRAVCPFHDDHSPSLVIYTSGTQQNESYCCYVDNMAGDVFHFIRGMEKDFKQAWSVLCHINNISDTDADKIDDLEIALNNKQQFEQARSINTINYQISQMYYQLSQKLQAESVNEKIDCRYKQLDLFLTTQPSYSEVRLYYKAELEIYKQIQRSIVTEDHSNK
jgi:DNA primase